MQGATLLDILSISANTKPTRIVPNISMIDPYAKCIIPNNKDEKITPIRGTSNALKIVLHLKVQKEQQKQDYTMGMWPLFH